MKFDRRKHILVVDDNPHVVETIHSILEGKGYMLESASTGNECLKKCEEKHFDLVFLDIMMPGMTGIEVAEKLRSKIGDKTKIVFVSINRKNEVCLKDVDDYVQKPFCVADILTAVDNHLHTNR